ncbi:unnamed protein product [Mytilus coruscus]|uniref:CCHC-type domain-containing protein n=1 Tax=Mytilus coruscus TaxID=42192 RepID=A0A6J8DYI0_MYTCO|nr:unnamed protein product [Mytilus coruscus]
MADGDVNALKKELDDVKLRLAKVIACKETVEPKVVFTPRERKLEKFSDFYICRQTENQTLQEFSHILMCKLDKICKRDHKCITDRDIVLCNQFAENVKPTWLKRELKKRIRGTHTISFNDIREEATLLMEDGDVQETSKQQENRTDDFEVPIFATQAKPSGTPDIAKVLEDLKSELQSIKSEVKTLKEEKQGPYRKTRDCYYCGKPGHIKRNCRSFIRDQSNGTRNKKSETVDLNENSLRQGAGP